jgi:hypothetical protein
MTACLAGMQGSDKESLWRKWFGKKQ